MRLIAIWSLFAGMALAAGVGGKWEATAVANNGREYKLQLELTEKDGAWTGTMASERGSVALENVRVEGEEVRYAMAVGQGRIEVKLKLEGESLKGGFESAEGMSGTITATRAAAKPDLAGAWTVIAKVRDEEHRLKLELKEEGGVWKGTVVAPSGNSIPLTDLKKEGDKVSFKLSTGEGTFTLKLAAEGKGMKGEYLGDGGQTGPLEATR
jgi:hypothetical protein